MISSTKCQQIVIVCFSC